jgi:hypothetical protein
VSFGNEVKDEKDEQAGRIPLDWSAKMGNASKRKRKTTLTQTLENSRSGRSPSSTSELIGTLPELPLNDARPKSNRERDFDDRHANERQATVTRTSRIASRPEQGIQDSLQEMIMPTEGDVTIDLNMPNSQSGKFWKAEYEQYHEEAKKEMEKLVGYKSLAKSFAKIKDKEAAALAEKLEEEQRKVIAMEEKVSQLTSRVTVAGLAGNDEDSLELIKELARQTALAVQYKAQVEEFRAALEGNGSKARTSRTEDEKSVALSQTDKTLRETCRELKKAREQLKDVEIIREERDQLRKTLAMAKKSAMKLQEENTKLTRELLHADTRFGSHLETCEKKQGSFDEHRQRKEDAFINLQKDYHKLKEQAKSQRWNAEHLLKKRHDQVVDLKKEISSLRNTGSTAQQHQNFPQSTTAEHEATVAAYKKQNDHVMGNKIQEADEDLLNAQTKDQKSEKSTSMLPSRTTLPSEALRESHIPIPTQFVARLSKAVAPLQTPQDQDPLMEHCRR